MLKDANGRLTTGEFAKLCDTTKETIMHYRRTGVLLPCGYSETGYCYYSPFQYFDYLSVRTLQIAGNSIKEIRELQETDGQSYLYLLEQMKQNYKKHMDEEIAKLKQVYMTLSNETAFLSTLSDIGLDTPFLEELKEEYLVETASAWDLKSYDEASKFKQHFSMLGKSNLQEDMSACFAFNYDSFFNSKDRSYRICSRLRRKPASVPYTRKPQGVYLSMYCGWIWDVLRPTFDDLLAYAQANHLEPAGDFYVYETLGKISFDKGKNSIAKISVRVEGAEENR